MTKIKKIFDYAKLKRKFNKLKIKYESGLEEKLEDKNKIIALQEKVIALEEVYNNKNKELKDIKDKYVKKIDKDKGKKDN